MKSVTTLVGTARHFRNCLATERKVVGALRGRAAYAVLRGEVVMEFLALSTGAFLFVAAHGKKNGPVSPELHALARAKCVAAGAPYIPTNGDRDGVFGELVDPTIGSSWSWQRKPTIQDVFRDERNGICEAVMRGISDDGDAWA